MIGTVSPFPEPFSIGLCFLVAALVIGATAWLVMSAFRYTDDEKEEW